MVFLNARSLLVVGLAHAPTAAYQLVELTQIEATVAIGDGR